MKKELKLLLTELITKLLQPVTEKFKAVKTARDLQLLPLITVSLKAVEFK